MRPEWLTYHEEYVQLHSGDWSQWLVHGEVIYEDEDVRSAVLDTWQTAIWRYLGGQDRSTRIYGIPNGGTIWASALAERLGVPPMLGYCAAEDERPTFIVDDVATTGASRSLFPEPALVVVRRGPVDVLSSAMDIFCLPIFKEKPAS